MSERKKIVITRTGGQCGKPIWSIVVDGKELADMCTDFSAHSSTGNSGGRVTLELIGEVEVHQ